jgi:hypothetical protein
MAWLSIILLVAGAFVIAVIASGKHFGQPRKERKDQKPDPEA